MALTQVQGGMLQGSTNTTTTIQSNGTTAITIDSTQNVGIGTSNPAPVTGFTTSRRVLQVTNSGYGQLILGGSSGTMIDHNDDANTTTTIRNRYGASSGSALMQLQSGYMTFGTGTSYTECMRITSDGYLKASNNGTYISSTGVYHELMQSRVDSYGLRVGITASSGGGYPMQLCWTTQTNNNTTDRYLTCSDATSTKMQVFSNGNIQNQNGSYGTISDIKNKENIVDATPKLDKVNQLKVRNFNLKDDETKLKQIGFIAQEFEEVFPSMVEESPDMDIDGNKTGETTKAIKTTVLIPILVKAIQELNAKVEAQAAEIAALKAAP